MSIESSTICLLTRDDITTILNERHLKIPNVESMSYQELLRIHETFAQPLEKRCSRRSSESVVQEQQLNKDFFHMKIPFTEDIQVHRVLSDNHGDLNDCPSTKYFKLSYNTHPSVARKRPCAITTNGAQEATPSKRKPITWP